VEVLVMECISWGAGVDDLGGKIIEKGFSVLLRGFGAEGKEPGRENMGSGFDFLLRDFI
jgi:hypothetical protein